MSRFCFRVCQGLAAVGILWAFSAGLGADELTAEAGLFRRIASPEVDYAWQSKEVYLPPDAEKFFPDDAEAGRELDEIFIRGEPKYVRNKNTLELVRRGLRRTRADGLRVIRWMGNTYFSRGAPQNPDAIELMYHAADFSGPHANRLGTRYWAVYFGLSVVDDKPPAILRTLVDLCLKVDDPNDLDCVVRGTKSQRDELLALLTPHLASTDEAERKKAQIVERIFKGELKAFAWAEEQARLRAQEKYADQLPQIKAELANGDTKSRRQLLEKILAERIALIMDDSFIAAFAQCVQDPDSKVRNNVAIIAGDRWVWRTEVQHPEAIRLMFGLSLDDNREVRHNAVYYGLSTVRKKDDQVIQRLLQMAFDEGELDLRRRISWGLATDKERTKVLLEEMIAKRAEVAREVYHEVTGEDWPAEAK